MQYNVVALNTLGLLVEGPLILRRENLGLSLGLVHRIHKTTFLSEHYVYNCNLWLEFRNTSFDKLAFDRRERVRRRCERVGRIIRPAMLKSR